MFDFISTQLHELLKSNQFLSGGLILGVLTGFIVYFKSLPGRLWRLFTRYYIVRVEIPNSDDCFSWLMKWFHTHGYHNKTNLLYLSTDTQSDSDDGNDGKKKLSYFVFSPGIGTHIFWYKYRPFWLFREREEGGKGITYDLKRVESFKIETFKKFKPYLYEFLNEIRTEFLGDTDNNINMYTPDCNYWQYEYKLPKRSFNTVFLDDSIQEFLLNDIQKFKDNKQFYSDRGIPYRRGYLFYGVPGTGKTSTIMALASYFHVDIYYLSLTSMKISDSEISKMLRSASNGAFIVIEDIDAIKSSRRNNTEKLPSMVVEVSFPALLNAIDGLGSQEGRIIFMTTNHKEELDSALIRPGRVDCQILFDYASPYVMLAMFKNFYPECTLKEEKDFNEIYKNLKNITPAELQSIFLSNNKIEDVLGKGYELKGIANDL